MSTVQAEPDTVPVGMSGFTTVVEHPLSDYSASVYSSSLAPDVSRMCSDTLTEPVVSRNHSASFVVSGFRRKSSASFVHVISRLGATVSAARGVFRMRSSASAPPAVSRMSSSDSTAAAVPRLDTIASAACDVETRMSPVTSATAVASRMDPIASFRTAASRARAVPSAGQRISQTASSIDIPDTSLSSPDASTAPVASRISSSSGRTSSSTYHLHPPSSRYPSSDFKPPPVQGVPVSLQELLSLLEHDPRRSSDTSSGRTQIRTAIASRPRIRFADQVDREPPQSRRLDTSSDVERAALQSRMRSWYLDRENARPAQGPLRMPSALEVATPQGSLRKAGLGSANNPRQRVTFRGCSGSISPPPGTCPSALHVPRRRPRRFRLSSAASARIRRSGAASSSGGPKRQKFRLSHAAYERNRRTRTQASGGNRRAKSPAPSPYSTEASSEGDGEGSGNEAEDEEIAYHERRFALGGGKPGKDADRETDEPEQPKLPVELDGAECPGKGADRARGRGLGRVRGHDLLRALAQADEVETSAEEGEGSSRQPAMEGRKKRGLRGLLKAAVRAPKSALKKLVRPRLPDAGVAVERVVQDPKMEVLPSSAEAAFETRFPVMKAVGKQQEAAAMWENFYEDVEWSFAEEVGASAASSSPEKKGRGWGRMLHFRRGGPRGANTEKTRESESPWQEMTEFAGVGSGAEEFSGDELWFSVRSKL
ncbi:MAG: hypothetical protein M1825_006296 [Sarcosagium campestre]|nr:MAG: hypothetical protein M1825_006296 [Sarcosagium campestre]